MPASTAAAGLGTMSGGGALTFARYAYPPNQLGYCGPADHQALLEHAAAGVAGRGLVELVRGFDGAWPYLELIAAASHLRDPLDPRVVEAYWIGNSLLERVAAAALVGSLEERFGTRAGGSLDRLVEAALAGAVPHHSLHVFAVYPWVGLLRSGATEDPLRVLDRCRVRWGEILIQDGPIVVVRYQPLTWDGHVLGLGPSTVERVTGAAGGLALAGALSPGDWVSLHWNWVCERLNSRKLAALRYYTVRQLAIVNQSAHSAPGAVLT
jgi:hypothetical protein